MRVSTKSLVYGTGGCFLGLLIGSYGLATPVSNVNNNVGNKLPISALNFSADKAGIMEGEAGIEKEGQTSTDTVICGGGPAGLLSAIMLAQKFPNQRINIYDRLQQPPSPTDDAVWRDFSKFYLIGLGGRGQTSLDKFGLWKPVEEVCTAVLGRKDWSPESDEAVERIFTDRKFKTEVLPRDKLVSVLYKYIKDNHANQVEFFHGYEVQPVDFGESSDRVFVSVHKCDAGSEVDPSCETAAFTHVKAGLLIAADGTSRTIANEMEIFDKEKRKSLNVLKRLLVGKPFRVKRYEDDNQRIYKTVPLKLPSEWRPDLNYSARSAGGRITFDALPANDKGEYCGVLLLRKDDELAQEDVDPQKLRAAMDELLPMFSEIMDDEVVAQVAKKGPSFLPAFRFVGPRLNQGDYTVVLGDCAHTVKPYFGLGANSALEDVKILSDCIDQTETMADAIQEFSKRRAKDSEVLVRISRSLDRPGFLGAITFIIPIILDSIFSKIAPKLFAPNIITMLQKDDITFQQVARRKRLDRINQLAIIGTFLSMFAGATRFALSAVARAFGRRSSTIALALFGSVVGLSFLRKLLPFLLPGMEPADVLAKSKTKITEGGKESISKKLA